MSEIQSKGMEEMKYKTYDIELIRRRRKTIAIEIHPDLSIRVRAPLRMPQYRIMEFLEEKEHWIDLHLEKMRQRQKSNADQASRISISEEEIKQLTELAKEVIPQRVAFFAAQMGVNYGRITIRNQKTRWGSCSQEGNLNFNCRLMKMPPEVLDYVVVHELCHRKQMNHSRAFWEEVEKVLPDYRVTRQWLKQNGR